MNLFFRPRLSGKARDWNWHHVFGIWAWLPLMLIVGSGVIMSYPWANNLLYTMTGSPLPPQPGALKGAPGKGGPAKGGPKGAPGEAKGGPAPGGFGPPGFGQPANWTGLGLAWPKAEQQVADWQTIRVQGSPNENAPFSFSIDRGDGTQPQLRGTLTVGRDGVVQKWADFSASSTGAQLRILARYAHTGEVIGVSGQWIAALATAAAAVMVYTGLALALRRFLGWRRRPAS